MKKNPLTIIFLTDGARPDTMKRLIDEGQLPNIEKEVLGQGTFRKATSVFPTTTGPAYLPILLGCFPGTSEIPGIRWFDKEKYRENRFGKYAKRNYCGPEAWYFNSDMEGDQLTLLEHFDRSYNIFNMITRGVPKEHDLAAKGKAWLYFRAHYFFTHQPVDDAAHHHLMRSLDMDPQFVFAVFPCVDWNSHVYHPEHEETIKSYKFLDYSVGEVVKKLKEQGRWDETLLIITSDHGLTQTHTHLDLADFLRSHGIRTMDYPVVLKFRPEAAVMISGNAFGSIHFLKKEYPNIMRGDQVKEAMGTAWDALLQREEIDFVSWRGAENEYFVASEKGEARIIGKEKLTYEPVTGDPFGFGAMMIPMDEQESLAATFESDYPDALVQIQQLFKTQRAGDLVVCANKGYDLRGFWEIPEHKGTHGSLHREHMHTPLIYNQKGWDDSPARSADIYNTVLEFMGKEVVGNVDGRSLIKKKVTA